MQQASVRVPWHIYGDLLRDIVAGNALLIEIGLRIPSDKLRDGYFHWLQERNLIRLKTSAEIIAQSIDPVVLRTPKSAPIPY